ncbi:MAG TPA: LacI family DNA-binding transcriptional regulator [Terriglobales bacterium]
MGKKASSSPTSRVDLRQIAKRTKLSVATVSRAINRVPSVDPVMAKRVWKMADKLGYFPNTQARALVSGKSRIFGLIVSEIGNPFFTELIHRFEEVAIEFGYEIFLIPRVINESQTELAVKRVMERRVDGVAVLTFRGEDSIVAQLREQNIPSIFVDTSQSSPVEESISVNYQSGIRQAIEHLAARQHRKIGFINGPLHLQSAQSKKTAFEDCMRSLHLQLIPEFLVTGDDTIRGGIRALASIVDGVDRPSAIMCSNDLTAIGVMHEAFNRGISIPKDLSIIGFDNISLAEFTIPPLTSVQIPQALLAEHAFHALRSSVENRPSKRFEILTNLVSRKSTSFALSN